MPLYLPPQGMAAHSMAELRQEIAVQKMLDHPNIVKVYETFEEEGLFHVVMELCCGGQVETRHAPLLAAPHRPARHVTSPHRVSLRARALAPRS